MLQTATFQKKGGGELRDHVESLRLFELSQMTAIVNQPELEHLRDCGDCRMAFIVLKVAFEPAPAVQRMLSRVYLKFH
jgi:hypothetical protein